MITSVLFDLDDTLIGNNMDTFLPQYFAMIDRFTFKNFDIPNFLPAMMKGVDALVNNTDPTAANNEVFWSEMEGLTGIDRKDAELLFNDFYRGEFSQLRQFTKCMPAAVSLIRACFRVGYKVVIATNPMFPRTAVEARLRWAGIPVDDFPYQLVTTIENMHATKPHQEYYSEILAKIGSEPEEAIMVGDDWQRDIVPAASLGLFTYWIQLQDATLPDMAIPSGHGSLEGLLAQIESGWLNRLSEFA